MHKNASTATNPHYRAVCVGMNLHECYNRLCSFVFCGAERDQKGQRTEMAESPTEAAKLLREQPDTNLVLVWCSGEQYLADWHELARTVAVLNPQPDVFFLGPAAKKQRECFFRYLEGALAVEDAARAELAATIQAWFRGHEIHPLRPLPAAA